MKKTVNPCTHPGYRSLRIAKKFAPPIETNMSATYMVFREWLDGVPDELTIDTIMKCCVAHYFEDRCFRIDYGEGYSENPNLDWANVLNHGTVYRFHARFGDNAGDRFSVTFYRFGAVTNVQLNVVGDAHRITAEIPTHYFDRLCQQTIFARAAIDDDATITHSKSATGYLFLIHSLISTQFQDSLDRYFEENDPVPVPVPAAPMALDD